MSEHTVEKDAHGRGCMCPWCASERAIYCTLSGSDDHTDHLLPTCPSSIFPPDA